jgi:hypothetical protein
MDFFKDKDDYDDLTHTLEDIINKYQNCKKNQFLLFYNLNFFIK